MYRLYRSFLVAIHKFFAVVWILSWCKELHSLTTNIVVTGTRRVFALPTHFIAMSFNLSSCQKEDL